MKTTLILATAVIVFSGCMVPPECQPRLQTKRADNRAIMTEQCVELKIRDGLMFEKPISEVRHNIKRCGKMAWLEYTEYLYENWCPEVSQLELDMILNGWKDKATQKAIDMGEMLLTKYPYKDKKLKKVRKPLAKPVGMDI